jgi:hypothetical protein
MPELQVNGVQLYYEEHGQEPPILCVHGTGGFRPVAGKQPRWPTGSASTSNDPAWPSALLAAPAW